MPSELESLKERRNKATFLLKKGKKFSPKEWEQLYGILDEIRLYEELETLAKFAPLSMNPEKIREHVDMVSRRLQSILPSEKTNKFCERLSGFYYGFKPETVTSYKEALTKHMEVANNLVKLIEN